MMQMVVKVFLAEQSKICKLHIQTWIKTTEHVGALLGFEISQKQRKRDITSDQGQNKSQFSLHSSACGCIIWKKVRLLLAAVKALFTDKLRYNEMQKTLTDIWPTNLTALIKLTLTKFFKGMCYQWQLKHQLGEQNNSAQQRKHQERFYCFNSLGSPLTRKCWLYIYINSLFSSQFNIYEE